VNSTNNIPPKRTFHDIVYHGFERPRVRLFMDLTDFDSHEMISLFDSAEAMIKTLLRYARSFGSLIDQKVMLPSGPPDDRQYDGLLRSINAEFMDFAAVGPAVPCIYLLVGTHPFFGNEAAELLALKGNAVIVIGKDARENAQVIQHDLVYYLSASKLADHGEKPEVENYDFTAFLQLLLVNEKRMPFVSAKYFISKQMWRLGSQNPETNQKIFQASIDKGLIILGKSENVDAGSMPVTTCKVNREHPLVKETLVKQEAQAKVEEAWDEPEPAPLLHRMDLSSVAVVPEK
jgi:hypothetical protein